MAEKNNHERKPREGKTEHSAPTGILETTDPFEVIGILVFIIVVGGYLIGKFVNFWQSDEPFWTAVYNYYIHLLSYLLPISILVSGLFLIGLVYSVRQLTRLNKQLKLKFHSSKGHGHGGHGHGGHDERMASGTRAQTCSGAASFHTDAERVVVVPGEPSDGQCENRERS